MAYWKSCCSGGGGVVLQQYYRQARSWSDGTLADVWLPADQIPSGPDPFMFYNVALSACFFIDFEDSPSTTPGTVAAAWQSFLTLADQNHICNGPRPPASSLE